MSGFTTERLAQWREFMSEIKRYNRLKQTYIDEFRPKIIAIPDGRSEKGKDPTGIWLPIVDKDWAIKDANGVSYGAFVTFKDKFIIYNFSNSTAYSYEYSSITGVSRDYSTIRIEFQNKNPVELKLKLKFGTGMAKTLFAVFAGMTASGNDYGRHRGARDIAEQSNAEMKEMVEFLDRICAFLMEAAQGTPNDGDYV